VRNREKAIGPDICRETAPVQGFSAHRGTFLPPGTRFTRCLERKTKPRDPMHINVILIQPLIALLFGILILILPRLLNYLIAIYLIIVGLSGLFPHLFATAT
jgi:hypothetical protein